MSNEVAIFENVLRPLTPHFEQALGNAMPVARLMRSMMISVERNPRLLKADRQTLLNAAMSAACLGLEVDGITGQAFFIPFAGKVQLVIGYKGLTTLAARSGFTIQGEVVREGDAFEYELGDRGYVRHKPKLGNKGEIIASWATASSLSRPSIVSVMGIDDLLAVRAGSPAVKNGADTPWNEMKIGFPAMCSKTAKRRLNRSMPLNADPRFHLAANMEENFEERGRMSWIDPERGLQIEGETTRDAPRINHEQRGTAELLLPPDDFKSTDVIPTDDEYIDRWRTDMQNASNPAHGKKLADTWNAEKIIRDQMIWAPGSFEKLQRDVRIAIETLKVPA